MLHGVKIVGAGPGDPELLTIKALNALKWAEIVVYDRLISQDILDLIPDSVELVYAGKSCKKHHMTQDEINASLVSYGKEKKKIVRLKGGDPFIFGRGGEEAIELRKNDIPFEIIPGVTAGIGISAALGIPLTHRNLASKLTFMTGHQQTGAPVNECALMDIETTYVIYMGLANIKMIVDAAIKDGYPADMPVAAVQSATMENQRVFFTTIEKLPDLLVEKEFSAPVSIVIGPVVGVACEIGLMEKDLG